MEQQSEILSTVANFRPFLMPPALFEEGKGEKETKRKEKEKKEKALSRAPIPDPLAS